MQRSSRRFHQIISGVDLEALFGPAQLHANNRRQNIFREENEGRVAHKGVDKTHKYIFMAGPWLPVLNGSTDPHPKGYQLTID